MKDWNLHWYINFVSFNGTQYRVGIYEDGYSGAPSLLIGAPEPFVTNENDSDDPFEPIRGQTGKIGFIGTVSQLEAIIPMNNTEKLVRLYDGTYNSTTQTFTENAIRWQGFLCAEALTQPWDGQSNLIELPVKSILQAMEDVRINPTTSANINTLAKLVVDAVNALGVQAYTHVTVISDVYDYSSTWPFIKLNGSQFVSVDEVSEEGSTSKVTSGKNFYDILTMVARLFGITIREDATTLISAQYDAAINQLKRRNYTWANWSTIANGSSVSVSESTLPSATSMMTALSFKGTANDITLVQGKSTGRVVLSLESNVEDILDLPKTEESSTTIKEQNILEGTLKIQPHNVRSDNREGWTFEAFEATQWVRLSSYTECEANSFINRPFYQPYAEAAALLYAGAFPIRWTLQPYGQAWTNSLKSALFFVGQYERMGLDPSVNETYSQMYRLDAAQINYFTQGYLDITATLYHLAVGGLYDGEDFRNLRIFQGQDTSGTWGARMRIAVRIGNYVWDGRDSQRWVSMGIGTIYTYAFDLTFDGPNVKKNADTYADVKRGNGFLIPITNSVQGMLSIYIFNICTFKTPDASTIYVSYNHILDDLKVEFIPQYAIAGSDRTENAYSQAITSAGFSDELEVKLDIGSYNNNNNGLSQFIRSFGNSDMYIESIAYISINGYTVHARPERRLLARLAAQYNQVRRVLTGIVASGVDYFTTRYQYYSRNFFGVKQQTNWRDDTEAVKFIEVG